MCNNDNKCGLSNMLAIISGIVMLAAAVSAAVYFVMRYLEKKERCDYMKEETIKRLNQAIVDLTK